MHSRQHGNKPRNLRMQNKKLIIELYRSKDVLSVTKIASQIRLSRTTVMKINDELLEEGIIEEAGKGASTDEGGKKPSLYRFNAKKKLILAFHVKYESIQFSIFDLTYRELIKDEIAIQKNESFSEISNKMRIILDHNTSNKQNDYPFLACMVAIHGNVDSEHGICIYSTHFPSWGIYSNFRDQLTNVLEIKCPIYIDNWIRYKAYGESRLGIARDHESVVLIDAGWHGVVAGILIGGNIYPGKHFLSGEIGHITINPHDKEPCECGNTGCFEQVISEKRVLTAIQKRMQDYPDSVLNSPDKKLDLHSVFQAADEGDFLARSCLDEIIYWFALAISNIIMFFDPEIILVEGDYASNCRYLEMGIDKRVNDLSLPRLTRKISIIFNNGESVPTLKGAAILGVDKFYNLSLND
jgi:predicted NBD/HSP70 family sugar kinase